MVSKILEISIFSYYDPPPGMNFVGSETELVKNRRKCNEQAPRTPDSQEIYMEV